MNFKLYTMVFALVYLITGVSLASDLTLTKKDMTEATRSVSSQDYYLVKAQLSPSGIKKIKKLKWPVNKKVRIKIAEEEQILNLKAPLQENFEMGPFSSDVARKIVQEVNNK